MIIIEMRSDFVKKKISLLTIVFVSISALMLILALLFDGIKIKGIYADFLWTFVVFAAASFLSINSCALLEKKNKLAIVSMSLIGLSSLLAIVCFWVNTPDAFTNFTLITCILSVCFNLITSGVLNLNKTYLAVQLVAYACYAVVSGYLIALIFKDDIFDGFNLQIFLVFVILAIVFLCIISVLSRKQVITDVAKEYVKITREEYEDLLAKKAELEKLKND